MNISFNLNYNKIKLQVHNNLISVQPFRFLYFQAHIHHYTKIDGFEADEFEQTKTSILNIIELYEQAGQYIRVPRLQVI